MSTWASVRSRRARGRRLCEPSLAGSGRARPRRIAGHRRSLVRDRLPGDGTARRRPSAPSVLPDHRRRPAVRRDTSLVTERTRLATRSSVRDPRDAGSGRRRALHQSNCNRGRRRPRHRDDGSHGRSAQRRGRDDRVDIARAALRVRRATSRRGHVGEHRPTRDPRRAALVASFRFPLTECREHRRAERRGSDSVEVVEDQQLLAPPTPQRAMKGQLPGSGGRESRRRHGHGSSVRSPRATPAHARRLLSSAASPVRRAHRHEHRDRPTAEQWRRVEDPC